MASIEEITSIDDTGWGLFFLNSLASAGNFEAAEIAAALQAVVGHCETSGTLHEACADLCQSSTSIDDWPYLRRGPVCAVSDGARLSTIMTTEAFRRFIVAAIPPSAGRFERHLPPEPEDTPTSVERYRRRLAGFMARPDWHRPDAVLGKPMPQPRNCWLSTDQFGDDGQAPTYGANEEAECRRDERALAYDNRPTAFLVELSFDSGHLGVRAADVRRPLAFDAGNRYFVVRLTGDRSAAFHGANWGATVHLRKLRDNPSGPWCGVPEAVSAPIPVSALPDIGVRFLGGAKAPVDGERLYARLKESLCSADELARLRGAVEAMLGNADV